MDIKKIIEDYESILNIVSNRLKELKRINNIPSISEEMNNMRKETERKMEQIRKDAELKINEIKKNIPTIIPNNQLMGNNFLGELKNGK